MNSRELVIEILSKELGISSRELIILTDQYGKPYLRDYSDVHFNISHTKNNLICGIFDRPIGVDIENIIPVRKPLVEKYFSVREQDYIFCQIERQSERFIEIWTKKEAYIKWVGKGFEIPFDSFCTVDDMRIKTNSVEDYIYSICTEIIIDDSEIEIIKS